MEQEISASDFKARCLAILDEVERTGITVTILKRGRPVAQLLPAVSRSTVPQERLRGTVTVLGDIVKSVEHEWEGDQLNL